MPPGYSAADFYYLLPELIVTLGAIAVLAVDVLLPRRETTDPEAIPAADRVMMWLSIATVVGAGIALLAAS